MKGTTTAYTTGDVALLGLGLMGGSLGLALKARGYPGRVRAYARRAETRAEALRLGAADEVFDHPADAVRGAVVVVACLPVLRIPSIIRAALPGLAPGAAVTDVGSTKAWLETACREVLSGTGAHFVGSHPVAGSEQQGLASADPDLYRDAVTVLTPAEGADPAAMARIEALWRFCGAAVLRLDAAVHDRVLAATSHLPHLAAAAVAAVVGRVGDSMVGRLCGTGFRDTTRIAAGSPEMWRDILVTNQAAILEEVEALARYLARLTGALRGQDFDAVLAMLEESRASRHRLLSAQEEGGQA